MNTIAERHAKYYVRKYGNAAEQRVRDMQQANLNRQLVSAHLDAVLALLLTKRY